MAGRASYHLEWWRSGFSFFFLRLRTRINSKPKIIGTLRLEVELQILILPYMSSTTILFKKFMDGFICYSSRQSKVVQTTKVAVFLIFCDDRVSCGQRPNI